MGIAVPMKMIEKNDAAIGEAGKANQILDEAFDLDQTGLGELVIIQSKTKTVDDPAFRATINETVDVLSASRRSSSCTRRWLPVTRARSRPTVTRS